MVTTKAKFIEMTNEHGKNFILGVIYRSPLNEVSSYETHKNI